MSRMRNAVGTAALLLLVTAISVSAQTTVILVRHAEKAAAPANDPPLTSEGQARATRLSDYLKSAGITTIYSTPYARTVNTAKPLADRLGLQVVQTPIQGAIPAFSQGLAEKLRAHRDETVLVVGHSNTVGPLIEALGATAVPAIADDEYDNLYIVTIRTNGTASVIRAKF